MNRHPGEAVFGKFTRYITVIMLAVLMAALTGCAGSTQPEREQTAVSTEVEAQPSPAPPPATAPEPKPAATPNPAPSSDGGYYDQYGNYITPEPDWKSIYEDYLRNQHPDPSEYYIPPPDDLYEPYEPPAGAKW